MLRFTSPPGTLVLPTSWEKALGMCVVASSFWTVTLPATASQRARPPMRAAQTSASARSTPASVKSAPPLLYISDWGHGTIVAFSQSKPELGPVGKISGLVEPTGIAVNSNGDVWVQDFGASLTPQVQAFHRGGATPFTTFAGGGGFGIALDSKGNLYVTDYGADIDIYPPGATTPKKRLTDTQATFILSVAVDDAGNILCETEVVPRSSGSTRYFIDEFKAGSDKAQRLRSDVNGQGTIAIFPNRDLLVLDGDVVERYAPPYTGAPMKTIPTESGTAMALSSTAKSVWIAHPNGGFVQGLQYNLDSGRRTHRTKHGGIGSVVYGIALDPPDL
jgi:hypothetical protein